MFLFLELLAFFLVHVHYLNLWMMFKFFCVVVISVVTKLSTAIHRFVSVTARRGPHTGKPFDPTYGLVEIPSMHSRLYWFTQDVYIHLLPICHLLPQFRLRCGPRIKKLIHPLIFAHISTATRRLLPEVLFPSKAVQPCYVRFYEHLNKSSKSVCNTCS